MSTPSAPPAKRPTRRRWLFIAAAVLAVVAAAAVLYIAFGPTLPRPASTGSGQHAATDGRQHAATEVTTISGSSVRVPGDKPTALLFFSETCGGCVQGGKNLAEAAHQSGSSATVLAVDMAPNETAADVHNFLRDIGDTGLPAALDPGAALTRAYGVKALTTVVVIDPAGRTVYQGIQPTTQQILDALKTAGPQ